MSIHLYQAEKKDLQTICDLLINFKDEDLVDLDYPEVDEPKLKNFINLLLTNIIIFYLIFHLDNHLIEQSVMECNKKEHHI